LSPESQSDGVNVSDLLAGMVFIFLVILAVFTIRFSWDKKELEFAKQELRNPSMTRQKILEDIRDQLERHGVHAESFAKEGVLSFNDEGIHFSQSEASPTKDRISNIAALASVLATVLPCYSHRTEQSTPHATPLWCRTKATTTEYHCLNTSYSGKIETIMIEGHTDPTPVKASASYPDNLTLSAMRASNVWNLLKECQPSLETLYNRADHNLFAVSGYAFLRPAYKNPKDPRNRRIDIRFVMDLPESALENASLSMKASGNTSLSVPR
jgi:chemotaxis protein MotB